MKFLRSLAIAATLASAAPASAQEVLIDQYFESGNFSWSGNGATLVTWRAVLIDGNIAICGAYSSRGGRKYADLSRQALADMRIDRPGGALLRNLSFFKRISTAAFDNKPAGTTANCRVTGIAGTPAELRQMRIGFTPQRYRF